MLDPLSALVTSAARARVLTALYAQPPRAFYQQELARETGLPLLAVQRELRRLVQAGILRVREVGGRRLYEADPASSIHSELQGIVAKLRGAGEMLRRALSRRKTVRLAWIFGSYARGEAGAQSDVDLMVIGQISSRELRSKAGEVERRLDRSINEHVMDGTEWTQRLAKGDGFLREVRRSPKIWIVGSEDELTKLDARRR